MAYEVDALPGLALILLSHEVALDPPVVGTDSALKLMDRSGAVLDLSGDYLDHRKGNFVNYSAGDFRAGLRGAAGELPGKS